MKLSDKALRQIGRKLLDRPDSTPHQDDRPHTDPAPTGTPGPLTHNSGPTRTAAVLNFRKRPD